MARRAIKNINWGSLAERMAGEEKLLFTNFKAKSEQYLRKLNENPEKAPTIDWAYYKKNLANPALVDKLQKEYEALKIPFPEDKYTSQIDAKQSDYMKEVQDHIDKWNAEIKNHEKEIEKIKSLIPYGQMTMEDFADAHPDFAFNREKPTIYPHTEEFQPTGTEWEDYKKSQHH